MGIGLCVSGHGFGHYIYMAASHSHAQQVTHALILLVGFVVSFIYAVIHKLRLTNTTSWLARFQLYTHRAGSLAMFTGLFVLYGGIVTPEQAETILAPSTIAVFVAALMMIAMVLKRTVVTSNTLAQS